MKKSIYVPLNSWVFFFQVCVSVSFLNIFALLSSMFLASKQNNCHCCQTNYPSGCVLRNSFTLFLNLSKLTTVDVSSAHSFIRLGSTGSLFGPLSSLGLQRELRQGIPSEEAWQSVASKVTSRKYVMMLYMICLRRSDMYCKNP